MRHLNSVVQGEYRDRVIVVHPQLRLYTRALGVFDALKGKVEMTAPRFNVSGSCVVQGKAVVSGRVFPSDPLPSQLRTVVLDSCVFGACFLGWGAVESGG